MILTTIAFKDGVLAGDTQVSWGGTPLYERKVFRIGRVLFGTAGSSEFTFLFYDWLKGGCSRIPDIRIENSPCALVYADGLFMFTDKFIPLPIPHPFWAIGSGCEYAIAAMHLGKSAVEAVETAMNLDANTGGSVYAIGVNGSIY